MNKRVILLTKHENEIFESMAKYHIDRGLFDAVVNIKPDDNKANYIKPERAIFVDNAYAERNAVRSKHNIPVFDVDGIDVLMDWRF